MSLTTPELAGMRTAANVWLPDTCTITRPTASHTASGAPKNAYSNVATGVACLMGEPSSATAEGVVNQAVGQVVHWPMHFKYDQDIKVTDRVVFGSFTYEVVEVLDSSSYLITRRAIIARIE